MGKLLRVSFVFAAFLLIPLVPFLWFGERIEAGVERWLSPPPSAATIFMLVVVVLTTDVFLPVPSSFVSTLAGTQLGIPSATLASWMGMTAGALFGFGVARAVGRPLVVRWTSPDDLAHIDRLSQQLGPRLLVLFRALPVLAEASVLLFGTTRLPWIRFFVPVALANLGIAAAYSVLGHYGRTQNLTLYALVASVAIPLVVTTMVRWRASMDD